jgi:alanine dehydrogenase
LKVLFVSQNEVKSVVSMHDAISAVEEAYKAQGEGKTIIDMMLYRVEDINGDMEVKSAYIGTKRQIGTKVVSNFFDNPVKYNLPSITATVILNDPKTGFPIAIMDGTYITAVRTGAAGAVAAKYLARKDSEIVGIIGAGMQGRMQLRALNELFSLSEVRVFDKYPDFVMRYVEEMGGELGLNIIAAESAEKAIKDADIAVTVTPTRTPIASGTWVKKGAHINAVGADMPGKQEWELDVYDRLSKIVVDSKKQCKIAGEIQEAIRTETISENDIYAEIGELVAGKKKGRELSTETTFFDTTGLAIQDVAVATSVYELADKKGIGRILEL